jgi:hypothetical protein
MAQTLNVFLVNLADNLSGRFDDSHRKTCAATLKSYFEEIIKSVARYNAVDVKWDGKQADPTAFDFVCYLLTSQKGSIVAKKGSGGTLGISGSTMASAADKTMVSEVYLQQIVQNGDPRGMATTNRETLVANCILHELAHNLLDASAPVVVDVHKLKKGVILRDTDDSALSGTDAPNEVDRGAVRTGFGRRTAGIKQYVGDMPA